jgi:hypothetical protein
MGASFDFAEVTAEPPVKSLSDTSFERLYWPSFRVRQRVAIFAKGSLRAGGLDRRKRNARSTRLRDGL